MAINLSDFLSARQDVRLQAELARLPSFPEHLQHFLVTGPERSGKTSILFHFAHSKAAGGNKVVFICKRAKLEQVPPLLPHGGDVKDPAYSNVQMRYLDTMAELRRYAACFHLLEAPPSALVVDDISDFLDSRILDRRMREADLVKTLALLHNAVTSVRRKGGAAGHTCVLLVSDTSPADSPHAVYLFKRWLPLTFAIKPRQAGDLEFALLPAAAEAHALAPGCLSQLHFSLASHSALVLTSVTASHQPGPPSDALAFL
ncbi:hypothetical protein WJX81_001571 [Elliptochloris bilobata]|uniref:Uncharacterized protein n=1 Tax=Elliptochloris bilobata TaxID=381761 RepID=A0AAW1QLZ7_9CHLO